MEVLLQHFGAVDKNPPDDGKLATCRNTLEVYSVSWEATLEKYRDKRRKILWLKQVIKFA